MKYNTKFNVILWILHCHSLKCENWLLTIHKYDKVYTHVYTYP